MDEFATVESYLRYGRYPDGMEKGEKANLRRKCHRNFKFEDGILYYRIALATQNDPSTEDGDEGWRVCVQTKEEKVWIMESHWNWRACEKYSIKIQILTRIRFCLCRRSSWKRQNSENHVSLLLEEHEHRVHQEM